jgi:hypothetical protein
MIPRAVFLSHSHTHTLNPPLCLDVFFHDDDRGTEGIDIAILVLATERIAHFTPP